MDQPREQIFRQRANTCIILSTDTQYCLNANQNVNFPKRLKWILFTCVNTQYCLNAILRNSRSWVDANTNEFFTVFPMHKTCDIVLLRPRYKEPIWSFISTLCLHRTNTKWLNLRYLIMVCLFQYVSWSKNLISHI